MDDHAAVRERAILPYRDCIGDADFSRLVPEGKRVSSAAFLQRALVVTDLCFLVLVASSEVVYSGYSNRVYFYATTWDRATHKFARKILRTMRDGVEMVGVWLIVIVTIDR